MPPASRRGGGRDRESRARDHARATAAAKAAAAARVEAAGVEEGDAEVDDDRTPEEVCSVLVARASTRAELDAVDRCALPPTLALALTLTLTLCQGCCG